MEEFLRQIEKFTYPIHPGAGPVRALGKGPTRFCFIRNLPQGLVLKVPYLKTSNQQIVVPKVP